VSIGGRQRNREEEVKKMSGKSLSQTTFDRHLTFALRATFSLCVKADRMREWPENTQVCTFVDTLGIHSIQQRLLYHQKPSKKKKESKTFKKIILELKKVTKLEGEARRKENVLFGKRETEKHKALIERILRA